MAFYKSSNPSFVKQGFSPTDHLCGFHLHINWKLLGVKKYLYVSNCSCSHALARCRELSSHSPALRGETTSWLQTSSAENLGHLGGISWTKYHGAIYCSSLEGAVCLFSLWQKTTCWVHFCLQVFSRNSPLCRLWLKEHVFCIVSAK